jgi:hypothetical protein
MKPRFILYLPFLFFAACGSNNEDGAKHAKGGTPVKLVICGHGETSCFVAARFDNLDSCQRHKKWAEMLCDSVSTPGMMICKEIPNTTAVSYCLP